VIERFDWTDHAEDRARQRDFDRILVEMAVRLGHDGRSRNDGRADWLVRGKELNGRAFEVVYDHPVGRDPSRVRLVSVWPVEEGE
jgi:Domain of unknown function (DUF4258)